jgi:predicted molibdopterin-dependent oxidoreductase YjgC
LFTRITDEASLRFTFDGAEVRARAGDSVAAALLAAGHVAFRDTAVSGSARGPFCMMGACFDCLVEIDGVPARQACMVPVAEGMRVARQRGAADYATEDGTEAGAA